MIRLLHAIHTACGIETHRSLNEVKKFTDCMQSIPLAVLKHVTDKFAEADYSVACNPYRLRYFFLFFGAFFSNGRFFLWHNGAIEKNLSGEG